MLPVLADERAGNPKTVVVVPVFGGIPVEGSTLYAIPQQEFLTARKSLQRGHQPQDELVMSLQCWPRLTCAGS